MPGLPHEEGSEPQHVAVYCVAVPPVLGLDCLFDNSYEQSI